jgi:hypothetical protein
MGNRKKLGKLAPISELTEADWVGELKHIDNQLDYVLDVFNFLEELFRLSNESEAALRAFNTTPLFWTVYRDCLQEAMFMGVARLCDNSSDTVNVTRVLNGAMKHPEFFSAEALGKRLATRDSTKTLSSHLVESAWVPGSGADLKFLKTAVSCHLHRIETIYLPIRNSHYGHRVTGIDDRALFEKTNRTELGETLDMLRQLMVGLRLLYDNGMKPRVDIQGTNTLLSADEVKATLDLTPPRRSLRDVVRAVAGCEL